jgi:tyrosine-protein phosphatase YwqE
VILTVNAATLCGSYGNLAKETALYAIEQGWVRMVCSDTHAPHHIAAVKELESSHVLAEMIASGTLLNPGIGLN